LDFFDRRQELPSAKRPSRPVADAGLGAARQEREEERERRGGARKQADHCSPSSEEDLAQAAGLAPEAQSLTRRIERQQLNRLLPFWRPQRRKSEMTGWSS
jgi:hypothetical protein